MKCIKDNQGNVTRVKDKVAAEMVKSNIATYSPKSEWKAQGRKKGRSRLPAEDR